MAAPRCRPGRRRGAAGRAATDPTASSSTPWTASCATIGATDAEIRPTSRRSSTTSASRGRGTDAHYAVGLYRSGECAEAVAALAKAEPTWPRNPSRASAGSGGSREPDARGLDSDGAATCCAERCRSVASRPPSPPPSLPPSPGSWRRPRRTCASEAADDYLRMTGCGAYNRRPPRHPRRRGAPRRAGDAAPPTSSRSFDTQAEADAEEAEIRRAKHNPNVVVWQDGYIEEHA